jgi:prolyl-tRNA synthetase
MPANASCKAVVYQKNATDEYVIAFIRGDLEVNETKLRNFLGEEIHPAEITQESGIVAGFIGPVGLPEGVTYVIDKSLAALNSSVCGANEENYHYTGYNVKRDTPDAQISDFAKTFEGATCPCCGKKTIRISRGIEVGNIFQLGTKYTKSMEMTYIGQDGKPHYPIMGCYGIGVGRLAASVCEVRHDDYGPIWPMSIAPWQVHICAIKATDPQVRETADALYDALQKAGVEVIFDDRKVSAGNMFSDADLLGVPVRVIVSPKTIKRGMVEVSKRDKSLREDVAPADAAAYVENLVREMLRECR